MQQDKSSEIKEQDVLEDEKKKRSKAMMNAVLIGFLIGIVLYSVMKNSLGFLTLIPLFFAYKLINKGNSKQ